MKKINPLLQIWVGKYLPATHIFLKKSTVLNWTEFFGLYYKRFFIHPLKRKIAKYYLFLLKKFTNLKVIGITGSAGKTTTKEMIKSILSLDGVTIASEKNIDPIYNIPSTILRCRLNTKYLVLEMGIEYPGEMDFYLWMAKPDIGVITNIYPAHTEFFKNVYGIFKEKSKLAEKLGRKDTIVLNCEDKLLIRLKNKLKAKVICFGKGGDVSSFQEKFIRTEKTAFILIFDRNYKNRIRVEIPIVGLHFVENALAAASVAKSLGISLENIKNGLQSYKPPEHRMSIVELKSGTILVDDSYNNNPMAAKKTLKSFVLIMGKKKKIVVFGDMLELGSLEERYHRELGSYISQNEFGINLLICVGNASKLTAQEAIKSMGKDKVYYFKDRQSAFLLLKNQLKPNTAILVKGSRMVGLDKLILQLLDF